LTVVDTLVGPALPDETRNGRRNHYEVHDDLLLRHPLEGHHTVGDLIGFLEGPAPKRPGRSSKRPRGF
jgi:hypothetical protein